MPEGVHYVQADVSTADGATWLARETLAHLGGLDILINNAGASTAFPGGIATIPDEHRQAALDANYLSAVRLTARLLTALTEGTDAAIVNISSSAALGAMPPPAHHAAAKSALESYSTALAAELAPRGVRVNVVIPGNVTTPGADRCGRTSPPADRPGSPAAGWWWTAASRGLRPASGTGRRTVSAVGIGRGAVLL